MQNRKLYFEDKNRTEVTYVMQTFWAILTIMKMHEMLLLINFDGKSILQRINVEEIWTITA